MALHFLSNRRKIDSAKICCLKIQKIITQKKQKFSQVKRPTRKAVNFREIKNDLERDEQNDKTTSWLNKDSWTMLTRILLYYPSILLVDISEDKLLVADE